MIKQALRMAVLTAFLAGCREQSLGRKMVPGGDTKMQYIPGEIWIDDGGRPIEAHGGGILLDRGTYYWYGEDKSPDDWNGTGAGRVSWVRCYSSWNLHIWHDEGTVLKAIRRKGHDLAPGRVVERPKVLFNRKTGTYVMWMHIDSANYKDARAGVAVSSTPTGPFEYLGGVRPDDSESRDMTVWQDDDGTAYLLHSSEGNATLHVSALSDDYLRPSGKFVRVFEGRYREAPAVFKHDGRYYIVSSHCTGWKPNEAECAVADSMMGDWKIAGNPCVGTEEQRKITFESQSTCVLPVPGKPGCFIFLADRWNANNLPNSRYVWLPLRVKEGKVEIFWRDGWDLNVFDAL
jgi:hypothetical protein